MTHTPTLSVITATYNAEDHLPNLINSLKNQTSHDFEWVIADGGSSDRTLSLAENARKDIPSITIDSRPDFGIYDALNRAVRIAKGTYYLVAGADDTIFNSAIENYIAAYHHTNADLISACIQADSQILDPRKRSFPSLYGPFAYVSGHAVGVAIRRSLHDSHGFYTRKLPIAADQLFLMNVIKGGGTVSVHDFIAGKYSLSGLSAQDTVGALVESYRVQIATGQPRSIQTLILLLRLIKNWRKLK